MSFNAIPSNSTVLLDDRLYLEIPPRFLQMEQPTTGSTAGGRWRAYLNQLCLEAVWPWLQEEQASNPRIWGRSTLDSIWEGVNGVAVICGTQRFILLPTVEIDQAELRVPQEWIDIPSWAGDYYLAVQVNFHDELVNVLGYTTHHQLKTQAEYDVDERMYCLNDDHLIHNVDVIQIAQHLCPDEPLRAPIGAIPVLERSQLTALLERLSNPAIVFPRLAVPFQLWAGLMQSEGWRQRLYERRQGLPDQWSIPQWLQQGISDLGTQLGWQLAPLRLAAQGMRSRDLDGPMQGLRREVAIANQRYELRIFPRAEQDQQVWRFELRSLTGELIPPGFKLRLLTDELQPFENNEDTAVEQTALLYVEVLIEPGEGIVWEIEPTPDDYVQEILSF
jgi:hypothetical protein